MFDIYFDNKTKVNMNEWEIMFTEIMKVAEKKLKLSKFNTNLSIVWIGKKEALKMNQEHRNQEYVPDVISFPIEMDKELIKQTKEMELGDIFICFEVAKQKAEHYHHDIKTEMAFLFVHGLLHLLGYDHETNKRDEKVMFKLQDKILKKYGIKYEVIYDDQDYLEGVKNGK